MAMPSGSKAHSAFRFLFEYDRGTERLSRLEAKLPGYAALARAAKHPTWVLFCFPSNGP